MKNNMQLQRGNNEKEKTAADTKRCGCINEELEVNLLTGEIKMEAEKVQIAKEADSYYRAFFPEGKDYIYYF